MAKRAFITGINGQDGAYLARLLLDKGYEVHGGLRHTSQGGLARLVALGVADDVTCHLFDLAEITGMQRVVDRVAPDEVYNLAAQSFVGASFETPIHTADIDAIGALRLLECLRTRGAATRFYQASSSEMFGNAQAVPQDEATPFHPRSPYGVSKLFAHWATVNYREAYGLFACSGILFNHESPLRGQSFVTRKITLGFARLRHGREQPLRLGNLEARRDWGFAGDYVEGMWRMLQAAMPADYVLATGVTTTIRRFVELAAAAFGFDLAWTGSGVEETGRDRRTGRVLVAVDPAFYRPTEVDRLVGDATRARDVLGWRPAVDLVGLVAMMARADDERVARNAVTI